MVSSHHIMEDGLISSLLHWMMGRVAVLELEKVPGPGRPLQRATEKGARLAQTEHLVMALGSGLQLWLPAPADGFQYSAVRLKIG